MSLFWRLLPFQPEHVPAELAFVSALVFPCALPILLPTFLLLLLVLLLLLLTISTTAATTTMMMAILAMVMTA